MTGSPAESSESKPKSSYLYFVSLYFVTVGVLYLWGYWSTFNINILEYLSLADVIRLTAYPIASAFIIVPITAALGQIIMGLTMGRRLIPGAGRDTPTGKTLWKYRKILLLVYLALLLFLFFSTSPFKWAALPGLLAIPVVIYASDRDFLIGVIPNHGTRYTVLIILATLPLLAFGHGRLNAYYIVDGFDFDYVLSTVDQLPVLDNAGETQRLRYLGHTGDFLFFLEPTKSILAITKFQDSKALLLKHFTRSAPSSQVSRVLPTQVQAPAKVAPHP